MSTLLSILLGVFMAAALGVLFMGIVNLARGGENSAERSNQLMRRRVLLQAAAVGILLLLFVIGK